MARMSKLETVSDWPALAKDCSYCVNAVANRVGVTVRLLEQFFRWKFPQPPIKMFALWMAADADKMANEEMVGKEIKEKMGYNHESSLTRALMNARGHGLRRDRKRPPQA